MAIDADGSADGLGRGLSALLHAPARVAARTAASTRSRRTRGSRATEIDEGALDELAASIRAVGVLQPVVVRRVRGGVVRARRRRAPVAREPGRAGLDADPRRSCARPATTRMLRDALIENLQRVDLNPLEEAAAYRQLLDDFGATHEEIAERVGRSRAGDHERAPAAPARADVQQRIAIGLDQRGARPCDRGARRPRERRRALPRGRRRGAQRPRDRGDGPRDGRRRGTALTERAPHAEAASERPAGDIGGREAALRYPFIRAYRSSSGAVADA